MPNSKSLIDLQQRLQLALEPGGAFKSTVWGDPGPMAKVTRTVEKTFDVIGAPPSNASIQSAVIGFCKRGNAASFNELKYVCYGVTLSLNKEGERLIDSGPLFAMVMRAVDGVRAEGKRFRRCYQALLQSYFSFSPPDEPGNATVAGRNFRTLRGYLSDHLSVIAKRSGSVSSPTWVITLQEHRNLLTDQPCDRYISELRGGQTDQLAGVCAGLGISRESWVWQEVILAYLRDICGRPDAAFEKAIKTALDIADSKTSLTPNSSTSRQIVAEVIRRYQKSSEHPEHPRLREMSLDHIGNPWLRKAAWDSWVKSEPTRKMVETWLKVRLIRDFFELLSDQGGGATDQRRLDYWLRFEPAMTDMWFALGPFARRNDSADFKELRKRMQGQQRTLDPSQGDMNNAFIMKMGKYVFIEFGVKGNACYFYKADELPFNLDHATLSIHKLKWLKENARSHIPSSSWESGFDSEFCRLVNFWPTNAKPLPKPPLPPPKPTPRPPTATDVRALLAWCHSQGIKVEDHRPNGGNLWIRTYAESAGEFKSWLIRLGFKFKSGSGYWLSSKD